VSLSADGNTAIVGGYASNGAGAARVWTRSGGVWTQQGTELVALDAVNNASGGDVEKPVSVSLSSDANTAIVGNHNDNGTIGAAWVWTRSGGVWTQQGAKLIGSDAVGQSQQGQSVSLSADGNTAIVGGNIDKSNTGAAWVWTRSGGVWTQQGPKLVGLDIVGGFADQGQSVSLSADGNTAIVGGIGDNSYAGAAWVWTRSGGIWTQQGTKLVGSGAVGNAQQGISVSLSADGNTAIIGGSEDASNGARAGAAWVWTRSGGVWIQQGTKLVGSGAAAGGYGWFAQQGFSVSLSADGNTAIVGGYADNFGVGATWVWTRSGGIWTQQGTKLVGSGAVGPYGAAQGFSVSLSADGTTAIVGGNADNSSAGAAWVFAVSASPFVWPPEITMQPVNQAVTVGQNSTFTVAADGSPTPMLQWQVSTNAGVTWTNLTNTSPYSGVTSTTLSVSSVPSSLNGTQFRCVATNSAGSAASAAATLTIKPAFTTQPTNQWVTSGDNVSFIVAASAAATLQWQVSPNGGFTFTDLTNAVPYTGVTSATLTVSSVPRDLNGTQFRCVATNTGGSTWSSPATLMVRVPQSPNLLWAKRAGGAGSDQANSVAVEASGNVYVAGYFQSPTITFGSTTLTNAGGSDIFIAKYDATGNVLWAKCIGGTGADVATSIALDATGNVYMTGYFNGTVDFDTGPGTYYLSSIGSNNSFVSKLDASGNFLWAKQFAGQAYSIAVDANGNIYTTGNFTGTVDFDPGPGIYNLTSSYAGDTSDMFVSKLESSGNFLWAEQFGGVASDWGNSIAVDVNGNVYITGMHSTSTPGDDSLWYPDRYKVNLIFKLDDSGNLLWQKQLGGSDAVTGNSIAVDAFGNVYTTGNFVGTVDFDPGMGVFNLTGSYDVFISKLDASGNFLWAKSMGGSGFDEGKSIATDAGGNVYTTGSFRYIADFDPGTGIYNLTVNRIQGYRNVFISKLDASGNFVWAESMGRSASDSGGNSIAIDANRNVYTTGYFVGTADFDPDIGTYNLTSAGSSDIFLAKLSSPMVPVITTQPVSLFRRTGENATFSVTADGQPPLCYQWHKGTGILANATNSSLSLTNVQFATASGYSVVVTNSFGSVTSAVAQLTVYTNMVLIQTNRAPTTNEIGKPTIPTDPNHFKVFTNGNFQSGVALNPNKMTVVLTHGWNSSSINWPQYMAGFITRRIGSNVVNLVAWDWTTDAHSKIIDLAIPTHKTSGNGIALGANLLAALGANYSQRIHFIGHSLGTLVNAAAANYVHTNGFSWTNTQMTLCDDAEIAWDFSNPNNPQFVSTVYATFKNLEANFSTAQPFWGTTLPNQFAWADNYITAFGLLHPEAANAILTDEYPRSTEPNVDSLYLDFLTYHDASYLWYDDTIVPSIFNPGGPTNATYLGFICSFEGGGAASRSATNTYFYQDPNGLELNLVQTNLAFATNFLNARFSGYFNIGRSSLLSQVGDWVFNGVGQAVGAVNGVIQGVGNNVGNMFVNLFTTGGGSPQIQSGSGHPLGGPVPNGGPTPINTPAYAWIPITVPSNAVSMSFDFMLQGNGNQDSFQVALQGANILSLEASLIQTNVTLNSGLLNVSQYAGQQVELFLGIVGGTSTNAALTVSNFQFYVTLPPSLQIQLAGTNVLLTWPLSGAGYVLQITDKLTPTNSWTTVTNVPAIVNFQYTVTNQIFGGSWFYRLATVSMVAPALQAQVFGSSFVLSWPVSAQNFSLQTTTNLVDPNSWTAVADTPAIVNLQCLVTNQISGAARFYRLRK
jgi:pimeloyl-ACP methyl ester carboxylesterase